MAKYKKSGSQIWPLGNKFDVNSQSIFKIPFGNGAMKSQIISEQNAKEYKLKDLQSNYRNNQQIPIVRF